MSDFPILITLFVVFSLVSLFTKLFIHTYIDGEEYGFLVWFGLPRCGTFIRYVIGMKGSFGISNVLFLWLN